MSRIRSTGTAPERRVEQALSALGISYLSQDRDLPGTPDLVLDSAQAAIFVHGCFWHQHPGCSRCTMPKTRRAYWKPKLARNAARGKKVSRELRALGWKVFVVWECQTKDPLQLNKLLNRKMKRKA